MIINVEDVFYDKPKFSTPIYFTLSVFIMLALAYHVGSGEQGNFATLFPVLLLLGSAMLYPAIIRYQFISRRRNAIERYKQHLMQLSESEMRNLLGHPNLSNFSKPILLDVGHQRFGK